MKKVFIILFIVLTSFCFADKAIAYSTSKLESGYVIEKSKIIDYCIVEDYTIELVVGKIKKYIEKGYIPIGNITVFYDAFYHRTNYYQAMVLYE